MKVLAALVATLSLTASVCAEAQSPDASGWTLRQEDVRQVAPALEKYTKDRLFGEVWERPGLSQRDRSIVTVSALIAREETAAMPYYFNQALGAVAPDSFSIRPTSYSVICGCVRT